MLPLSYAVYIFWLLHGVCTHQVRVRPQNTTIPLEVK